MRHRNRFKKSAKSPFDESGPNATALRRSLEWLQTHHPDAPSVKASEQLLSQTREVLRRTEDALKEALSEYVAQEAVPAAQPEPPIEIEPATIETPQAETLEIAPVTTEAPQAEAAPAEPVQPEAAEPDRTDEIIPELADLEEAQAEQSEIRNVRRARRHRPLDPRRFPKHADTVNGPIDLHRHIRRCCICQHPEREAIEEAFIQWRRPGDIRYEFQLPNRSAIYRHAHAFDLFGRRIRCMRFGLENIIEESSHCVVTADSIIRAVRAHSSLDENGRWVEPPRKLIIAREVIPAPAPALTNPKRQTQIIDLDPASADSEASGEHSGGAN